MACLTETGGRKRTLEKMVGNTRRSTRKHDAAKDRIHIVLEGLRSGDSVAVLCPREAIADGLLRGTLSTRQSKGAGRWLRGNHRARHDAPQGYQPASWANDRLSPSADACIRPPPPDMQFIDAAITCFRTDH